MNWKDRHGNYVFRSSPDSAWPLDCDSGSNSKSENSRSEVEAEGLQSGAVQQAHRPDYSAKVKRVNLKVVS